MQDNTGSDMIPPFRDMSMISLSAQSGLPYWEIKDLYRCIDEKFGETYPDEEKDYTATLAKTMISIGFWPIDSDNSEYDAVIVAIAANSQQ